MNREIQDGLCIAKSVPYAATSAPWRSDGLGSPAWSTSAFLEDDPVRTAAIRPVDGTDATALGTHTDLRLLVHLDLGDHPAGRGIQPGEVDAGSLADDTAASVAADEILRPKRRAVGQLDVDATVVVGQTHDLTFPKDRNPELGDPAGKDALEVALPERQEVVVATGEVADVQPDAAEPNARVRLALRNEALRDATLVEHLDRARVQTTSTRSVEVLARASFDDDDVDPGQCQLGRQHQPGRTAACDHHCMLGHRHTTSITSISNCAVVAFACTRKSCGGS